VSLQPQTFAEAKVAFKPLKRGAIKRRPLGKKSRRAKRPTVGQLKKNAWKEFSIYIRTRGADDNGFNVCCTCGIKKFWKDLQAGHFIRGRLNANLFDERGVWPQCYSCNIGAQGNVVVYYKWMLEKFGQEVIDELLAQNNVTRKWLPGELVGLIEKYKALNESNPLVEN
jgi:hypothetical protein